MIKNKKNRQWRSNKVIQMDIPGMGRVIGQRIGLKTLGTSVVVRRHQHGGLQRNLIVKIRNYENVDTVFISCTLSWRAFYVIRSRNLYHRKYTAWERLARSAFSYWKAVTGVPVDMPA
jgi:hypothetical protein